jgi:hypothetical protein
MPNVPTAHFPNLVFGNYQDTSRPTKKYNCIAWAMGEDHRRWDVAPGYYWPEGISRSWTLEGLEAAFATKGYFPCANGTLEDGVEKIVLYAAMYGMRVHPTHAALQRPSGKWTSKLGHEDDLDHDHPDVLSGPGYGQVFKYYSRPRRVA